MKNLGNKLRSAREALGVSVRDAADATRLRANIIENMEAGEFSYSLPEIYKRGFLRIYAAFLKLDVDATMAEYTLASKHSSMDESTRKNLMQRVVSLQSREPVPTSENRFANDTEFAPSQPASATDADDDPMRYIKLGGIFVGVLLAVVVIIYTASSLVRSNAPELNSDIAEAPVQTQPADISAPVADQSAAPKKELVLAVTALQDTHIMIYSENNMEKPLIAGPIQAGERKVFTSATPLMVKLVDAEKVKLERNSKALPLVDGTGKQLTGIKLFKVSLPK